MIKRLVVIFLSLSLLGARFFDGTDDWMRNTTDTPPATATPLSFSCWFRTDQDGSNKTIISVGDDGAADNFFRLQASMSDIGDPVGMRTRSPTINFSAKTSTAISVNTWHHACGRTASSTSRDAYLDGAGKGSSAGDVTPTVVDATGIGTDPDVGSRWSGDLAHCAMWKVALSDQECATLAAGVSPLRVDRDNLIAYWPINGQSPEIDIVGGVNLTINSSPAVSEEPPPFFAPIVAP